MELTKIHPIILIMYYLILMLFAFLFNNPYYLITFGILMSILLILQGAISEFKTIVKAFIPLTIVITLLNTLFTRVGNTHILIIGSYYVTFEAIAYGIIMAISFMLIILTFVSYNNYVSYQDMLYVFSKKFPNLAMIIIMALRFIPLIRTRSQELRKLASLKNNNDKPTIKEKLIDLAHNLGLVVSWSLEESMITASSMKARGYNITKRTSYMYYPFTRMDFGLIIFLTCCIIISIIGLIQGIGKINVYPVFIFSFNQLPLNIYYLAYILLFVPFILIELQERILWHL